MDIRNLSRVLVLICAVIHVSTGTKQDEKLLENSVAGTDCNLDGTQDNDTVVTLPKDGDYKLSYADYELTWRNFKLEHNKTYSSISEEKRRFSIFMEKVKKIEAHNMEYHLGQSTYWMGINFLSDWTKEELEAWMGPLDVKSRSKRAVGYTDTLGAKVPDRIDWRKRGYVTPVKDQGRCGSCYAFSTTGAVEGQWKRKRGKLINLSEQQIVDCSTGFGNNGCDGGDQMVSFKYIRSAGGLQSEATYPYRAQKRSCKFDKSKVAARIQGYIKIPHTEAALKGYVGMNGPVTVSIFVSDNFHSYAGGIFKDPECRGVSTLNHAMLVVGYGRNVDGKRYWIVKNCHGRNWGEKGYIRIARNTGGMGMCGIAREPSIPVVSKGSNELENNAITVLVASTLVFVKVTQLDLDLYF